MPAHRKVAREQSPAAPRTGPKPPLLDRWPFRRKLNVLVIVPLAVVSAILAYVVYAQVDQARSAASTAQRVRDSAQMTRLIDGVQTEHQQALLISLRYEAAGPEEGIAAAKRQLLERLETVGGEARRDHRELAHALARTPGERDVGGGFEPFRSAEA